MNCLVNGKYFLCPLNDNLNCRVTSHRQEGRITGWALLLIRGNSWVPSPLPLFFGISIFFSEGSKTHSFIKIQNVVETKTMDLAWLKGLWVFAIVGCLVFQEKLPSKPCLRSQFIKCYNIKHCRSQSPIKHWNIQRVWLNIQRSKWVVISLKIQLLTKPGPLETDLAGRMKGSRAKSQTGPCLVTAIIIKESWIPHLSNPLE